MRATTTAIRPAHRVLGALLAVWLVVGGVLAARHDAQVGHVVDPRTGELCHAATIGSHQASTQTHVHSAEGHDADGCAIEMALRQAARPSSAAPPLATSWLPVVAVVATVEAAGPVANALYRLAPKTSPPTIA